MMVGCRGESSSTKKEFRGKVNLAFLLSPFSVVNIRVLLQKGRFGRFAVFWETWSGKRECCFSGRD